MMGFKAAETRLRETNMDFSFLTRESDIKKGKFILSWLAKDGSVMHTAAPIPSARNNFQKLEEALSMLEQMIESNDECVNPVPPRGNDISDENNNSVDYESPSEHACYACEFVAGHLRELRDHERKHTVKECPHCNTFIHYKSHRGHIIRCQKTPPEVHACDKCDYKTPLIQNLRRHLEIHNMGFKCDL